MAGADPQVRVGVAVIVTRGDRILLGQRKGAHGAGTWALPGGHLEFGESLEACARREVFEETGLRIDGIRRVDFTNDLFRAEGKHYVTLFVAADCGAGEPLLREPEKCARWEWFSGSSLPGPLFLPLRNFVAQRRGTGLFRAEKPAAEPPGSLEADAGLPGAPDDNDVNIEVNFMGKNETGWRIENRYVPGAIGRVSELHGVYYHEHWGFGLYFEAKVATELSAFLSRYDERRDGAWIATSGGRVEGSIFIDGIHAAGEGAHLRWFILSDALRGRGLGRELVKRAVDFCRHRGYPKIHLWTFEGLDAAKHLYEDAGFRLVRQKRGIQWGTEVNEQYYEWIADSPGERSS